MFYLIDGYNFVLDSGLSRTLRGPGNLERARSRLLMWLSSRLDETQRARTTVVFDAKRYTVDKKEILDHGIRVMFAVDHPDADSLIEELIATHSAPKFLTVVSSDQRILAAAHRRHAQAMKSPDWFEQIEHRSRAAPATAEAEEKTPVGESEKLVAEFDTPEIRRLIDDETEEYP